MKNHIKMGRMSGLSLVELLVAATISTLLLTAAISIFLASKESFNVSEDISRVQENIRYTSGRIFRDVSTAGYMGCAPFVSANRSTVPNMVADSLGDFSKAIIGGESVGPNESDSLTLHYARIDTAVPYDDSRGAYSGGNTGFQANAASGDYQEDDIIVMGVIDENIPPILKRIGIEPIQFIQCAGDFMHIFGLTVGAPPLMAACCARRQVKFLRGIKASREMLGAA